MPIHDRKTIGVKSMPGYIDIHNHILPGLDDGPRTINESIMLARAMVAVGYDTVIATPHTFESKPAPALISERLQELQHELNRQSVPLNLLPGSEPHIEPGIIAQLETGELQTLNNTRYFFIELPFYQTMPPYIEQLLFELKAKGYRPIIPHPERTAALQQDPQLLHRLHSAGALFQVTWGALVGWLGPAPQKAARAMLSANLAHLFSTDAHNAVSRAVTVAKPVAYLNKEKGSGTAGLYLSVRPRQLLAGQVIELPAPAKTSTPLTAFHNHVE